MKIRTLIVDDEPLAREKLAALLAAEPEIEIIGECGDGLQAVAAIEAQRPELVLLDVQMPELDGFGVLEAVGERLMPVVIFVTAYDQYALRAFEAHALDYLLKPFDRERLRKSLERVRRQIERERTGEINQQLVALLSDLKAREQTLERLVIKAGGRVFFLRVEEIDWIEAAANYVKLHTGRETHLLRETMNGLEAKLDVAQFIRIHRSVIVNVERIKELHPLFHGEYSVTLLDGTQLTLSRGYRDRLQQLLGKEL